MPSPRFFFNGEDYEQDQLIDTRFGRWLKDQREAACMSVFEAAPAAGVSTSRWISIERGARVKAATRTEIEGIARCLSINKQIVVQIACGGIP